MISSASELREARALQLEAAAELEREAVAFGKDARMGLMIEVPAAALAAEQLAREAAFFSIGTNDLTQYVMAADRTNAAVAATADPFQPPVLRLIRDVIQCARAAGIGVAVCGELAADPLATPLLIGFGLEEFSLSAPLIPELKRAISLWTLPEAEATARDALALESAETVREFLTAKLILICFQDDTKSDTIGACQDPAGSIPNSWPRRGPRSPKPPTRRNYGLPKPSFCPPWPIPLWSKRRRCSA